MKSLIQFLFIVGISLGLIAPTALAKKKLPREAQHRELPQKKGVRKPDSSHHQKHKKHNKHGKKKGHQKHRGASARP